MSWSCGTASCRYDERCSNGTAIPCGGTGSCARADTGLGCFCAVQFLDLSEPDSFDVAISSLVRLLDCTGGSKIPDALALDGLRVRVASPLPAGGGGVVSN